MFIQTATGIRFNPLEPKFSDLHLYDIVHGLSHICRFGGQCKEFYSVAQHSLLVASLCPDHRLAALLHDGSEAYLGDISGPIKPFLPQYLEAEKRLQRMIFEKFAGISECPKEVKEADQEALAIEANYLMGNTEGWGLVDTVLVMLPKKSTPEQVRDGFMREIRYARNEFLLPPDDSYSPKGWIPEV